MPDNPLIVDGHVHITNRVHWEGLDPWQPQPFGFDYARAKAAGVGVVIENVGTYGYANFNYTPKQTLRLVEAFHATLERHADVMGLALTVADARRLVAQGRLAVFLGVEAGFDHEGDPDVLRALYRLGLRVVHSRPKPAPTRSPTPRSAVHRQDGASPTAAVPWSTP